MTNVAESCEVFLSGHISPFSLILVVLGGVYNVMLETNCRGVFFLPEPLSVVASQLHKNELS